MKTKLTLWLLLVFIAICQLCYAQKDNCSGIDQLIGKANALMENNKFKAALDKLAYARKLCSEKSEAIDEKIVAVYRRIEKQKQAEEAAKKRAIIAEQQARAEAKRALEAEVEAQTAQKEAEKAKSEVDKNLKDLIQKQDSLKASAQKNQALQNAFISKNTLAYLYQQARFHMTYDSILIARNYRDALPYYALANFLEEKDSTKQWIQICQYGVKANDFFSAGALDSAEMYFQKTLEILVEIQRNAPYEKLRLNHIDELRNLSNQKRVALKASIDSLVLEGNWWTLPQEFYSIENIRRIVIKNNKAIRGNWPFVAENFSGVTTMAIYDCPNLNNLKDWSAFQNLEKLEIKRNPELETIEMLDDLPRLLSLKIENNGRLKWIKGLTTLLQLRELTVLGNERMYRLDELPFSDSLEVLLLSKIRQHKVIDLKPYKNLKHLALDSLPQLEKILGLANLPVIKTLKIAHNPQLDSIGNLSGLEQLEELIIVKNDSILSLADLTNLQNLKCITIDSNDLLKHLPNWRNLPSLRQIYCSDNKRVRNFSNLLPLNDLIEAKVLGNNQLLLFTFGTHFGIRFGGQNAIKELPNTRFTHPLLTFSTSFKWLKFSIQGEYSISPRSYYFPNQKYLFETCEECLKYFEPFKLTDPKQYEKRQICEANKNRVRIILKYDVYPYFQVGPVYSLGLGFTPTPRSNFPFSLAVSIKYPWKFLSNCHYISLDWRLDASEIQRPHNISFFNDLSIGYNLRLGYKKTHFRESSALQVGNTRPRRMF